MSDEGKGSSAAPGKVSDDTKEATTQEPVSDGKNTVQYESYRRAVGDGKKWKSKYDDIETKFTELQQKELERDGKKDELIEQLRKSNVDLSSKLNTAVGNFASSKAYDVIVDEAVKMGCTSTKLLKKIVVDELKTLDYDDSFNPDADQVKAMLVKIKQDEPVLFQKAGPRINPHIPVTNVNYNSSGKSYSQMSKEELEAEAMKQDSIIT